MPRPFRSQRTPAGMGVFTLMAEARLAAARGGRAVVDLSVGTPDLPPPPEALEALKVGRLRSVGRFVARLVKRSLCSRCSGVLCDGGRDQRHQPQWCVPHVLLSYCSMLTQTKTQLAIDDAATYQYCLRNGTMPLLAEAAAWFGRHYGVELDPATEALSLIGSQEGLGHLLLATADPGDGILMCSVG
jgi:hypothetical protein